MNKGKSYIRIITIIYVAAIILTVFSFIGLGFSESLFRFVISLVAVLLAESVVYGYCIFGSVLQVVCSGPHPFFSAVHSSRGFMRLEYSHRLLSSIGYWSCPLCGMLPFNC